MLYGIRRYISNKIKSITAGILVSNESISTLLKSKLIIENSNLTNLLALERISKVDKQLSVLDLAYKLDHDGRYHDAATLRSNLLTDIYEEAKVEDDYFPPLFGGRWTSYIGHLAVLALHSKAQELGLVSKGRRILLTTGSVANQKLCDSLGENYLQISDPYLANLEFFPPTQVLFENYHSIRTKYGFLETHRFIEQVFLENLNQNHGAPILSEEMIENSIDSDSKIKFFSQVNGPFVAIHLRSTGKHERRDVVPDTYFEAFNSLAKKGYSIVNIGPEIESKLGVEIININDRDLHPYIMLKADMAITSTSGPSLLPSLVGTPNLVSNVTSIGRNMINCNQTTFYLPKHFYLNDEELNFKEILNREIAFDERERAELDGMGIRFEDNSNEEIKDAVNWLITAIETSNFEVNDVDLKVKSIQKVQKAVSFGRLIPTYIDSNRNFLN